METLGPLQPQPSTISCSSRCIFAHGNPAPTLTEGCLRNIPSVAQLNEGLTSKKAAKEFVLVYEKLKTDGQNAIISYLQLCMIYRFLSNRVMVSVGVAISNISMRQPKLWNHQGYFLEKPGPLIVTDQSDKNVYADLVMPSPQSDPPPM